MKEPIDEWLEKEAHEEIKLMRRPHCCECQEPVQGEWFYIIDGDYYCEDCIDEAKHCMEELEED